MDDLVGSKGGSGVCQWLRSLMPAHSVYVEGFLGRGVLLRSKVPARRNIGIELDLGVLQEFKACIDGADYAGLELIHGDVFEELPKLSVPADGLVYLDPPYLGSTRSHRRYYLCELITDEDHIRLLQLANALSCRVMISGYRSELYSSMLPEWRVSSFWTVNRAGVRCEEICWMNFPEPVFYHDVYVAGVDFTDRQRVKRKVARWVRRLSSMPAAERQAILDALLDLA